MNLSKQCGLLVCHLTNESLNDSFASPEHIDAQVNHIDREMGCEKYLFEWYIEMSDERT